MPGTLNGFKIQFYVFCNDDDIDNNRTEWIIVPDRGQSHLKYLGWKTLNGFIQIEVHLKYIRYFPSQLNARISDIWAHISTSLNLVIIMLNAFDDFIQFPRIEPNTIGYLIHCSLFHCLELGLLNFSIKGFSAKA